MEERTRAMSLLLEHRDRRVFKRDISRLSLADVRAELHERGCSSDGSEEVLRERLWRVVWREREPDNALIPWYAWDLQETAFSGDEVAIPSVSEEIERTVAGGKRRSCLREQAPAREEVYAQQPLQEQLLSLPTDSASSGAKQSGLRLLALSEVQVHAPASLPASVVVSSATTCASFVTTTVTTAAGSATLTSTHVTPSCARPPVGANRVLFYMQTVPSISVVPTGNEILEGQQ